LSLALAARGGARQRADNGELDRSWLPREYLRNEQTWAARTHIALELSFRSIPLAALYDPVTSSNGRTSTWRRK
jgi:hypothetical protein